MCNIKHSKGKMKNLSKGLALLVVFRLLSAGSETKKSCRVIQ
ncbi:hypothetical protein D1BOALGB6SA_7878 [Olavius sp. associated proteobacterium Delta 1]|nr:hypothetical protein D1BOALGB6SA_7878 [Olavius sp. associated proteobacterium Delta 1]